MVAGGLFLAGLVSFSATCFGAERVTLRNGFELDCARQESAGDRVRLYLLGVDSGAMAQGNFIEVRAAEILRSEPLQVAPVVQPTTRLETTAAHELTAEPTAAEMGQMLAAAGTKHNVDADLLASVVRAESGGHSHAVSRAGARGLMQLMPGTAAELGVADAFAADQNIGAGTAYLDELLTRYHENLAFALAAYNAGPAAVDRYRGVPPYPETRAYVARVIREFNRRKSLESATANRATLVAK
jgi:soluble lytic murein transglycosylase-like protein